MERQGVLLKNKKMLGVEKIKFQLVNRFKSGRLKLVVFFMILARGSLKCQVIYDNNSVQLGENL